jgi:hypothetical protein
VVVWWQISDMIDVWCFGLVTVVTELEWACRGGEHGMGKWWCDELVI